MMNRLKAAALAVALWMLPAAALAQSSPGWPFGYVPTVAEWNAAFSAKADYTGSSPITAAGGTFTGKVTFANSAAGTAGMNCGVGTAPSSPINGDIWCTTAGMFVQINGSTVGPLGAGAGGTLAVNAGGTGVTTITSGNVLIGQGTSPITSYPTSGTNTRIASTTITSAGSGHCVSINGAGDLVDAGVGACGGSGGSGTVNSSTIGQIAVYTGATAVTGIAACNNGYYGTNGSGTVSCITTVNTTLSATITALGTIASGTWQGGVIAGQYGGTNAANTGRTITLGGDFVHATAGTETLTLTTIGATNVTLPTTGTLMNQNGTSGGIPYYNSATTVQSSGALTANLPLFGGGAAASPFSGTRTGNTTNVATYTGSAPTSTHCAQWDASGNLTDSGATCAGASGGAVLLATLPPTPGAAASLTDVGNCGTGGSTGCFTNTYLNYLVVLTNVVAGTPSTGVGCQIAIWNGSYQVSGYITSSTQTANGGTVFVPATPTTYIPCSQVGASSGANSGGAPGVSGQFTFYNPSAAAKPQVDGRYTLTGGSTGSPTVYWGLTSGMYNSSGAITGFRVCYGTVGGTCAGTIASGSVKVYGLP